jgi:hypothetical protein
MNSGQFNEKYKDFLEEGHYGLDLDKPEAIAYLDEKFQEFIKRPNFKYFQIKAKFDWFCFYAYGVTVPEILEVEEKLQEIYAA